MLKVRIAKRNYSVCAFCQHRLSLRQAHSHRRLFSCTRQVHDNPGPAPSNPSSGWEAPAFARPRPATAQEGSQPSLLSHEEEARKLLAEKPPPPPPSPEKPPIFLPVPESRYKLYGDTEKQLEFEQMMSGIGQGGVHLRLDQLGQPTKWISNMSSAGIGAVSTPDLDTKTTYSVGSRTGEGLSDAKTRHLRSSSSQRNSKRLDRVITISKIPSDKPKPGSVQDSTTKPFKFRQYTIKSSSSSNKPASVDDSKLKTASPSPKTQNGSPATSASMTSPEATDVSSVQTNSTSDLSSPLPAHPAHYTDFTQLPDSDSEPSSSQNDAATTVSSCPSEITDRRSVETETSIDSSSPLPSQKGASADFTQLPSLDGESLSSEDVGPVSQDPEPKSTPAVGGWGVTSFANQKSPTISEDIPIKDSILAATQPKAEKPPPGPKTRKPLLPSLDSGPVSLAQRDPASLPLIEDSILAATQPEAEKPSRRPKTRKPLLPSLDSGPVSVVQRDPASLPQKKATNIQGTDSSKRVDRETHDVDSQSSPFPPFKAAGRTGPLQTGMVAPPSTTSYIRRVYQDVREKPAPGESQSLETKTGDAKSQETSTVDEGNQKLSTVGEDNQKTTTVDEESQKASTVNKDTQKVPSVDENSQKVSIIDGDSHEASTVHEDSQISDTTKDIILEPRSPATSPSSTQGGEAASEPTISPQWDSSPFASKKVSDILDVVSEPKPVITGLNSIQNGSTAWGARPFARKVTEPFDESVHPGRIGIEKKLDENLSYMPEADRRRKHDFSQDNLGDAAGASSNSQDSADTATSPVNANTVQPLDAMETAISSDDMNMSQFADKAQDSNTAWGSLIKKATNKTTPEDFWETVEKAVGTSEDAGRVSDPQSQQLVQPEAVKDEEQSQTRPSKDFTKDWDIKKQEQTTASSTADWGDEYDELLKRRESRDKPTTAQKNQFSSNWDIKTSAPTKASTTADWGEEYDDLPKRRERHGKSAMAHDKVSGGWDIKTTEQTKGSSTADWGEEYDELPKRQDRYGKPVSQAHPPGEQSSGLNDMDLGALAEADNSRRSQRFDGVGGDEHGMEDNRKRRDKKRRGRDGGRSSRYEEDDADDGYDDYMERKRQKAERKAQREAERTEAIPIVLPELITVSGLADSLRVERNLFLSQMGELGFEDISLDSVMAGETAALVAQEYGYEPTIEVDQDLKPRPAPEDASILPPRPPVVTIMGHVDHGKTTLLDYLRESSIAAQEHGGITQHIGAFSVKMSSGKQITFLDTPGHAAFLTMRQRGANVTDIVVLVVAADDSVKPQTKEAIKHARAAKVPIIVAINKVDKEGARIEQVKSDLAANGVDIEDFGGDVQVVCVSGKTGQGMDDLEENISTLSEILDHRAEIDGPAEGWILESSLKPTGRAATILVKRGTLRTGDIIAAGTTWARIRSMKNEAGAVIEEAPPGTPVEIMGWRELPAAGDAVIQAPDEKRARVAVSYREGLRDREKDAKDHERIAAERRQRATERMAEESQGKRQYGNWGTIEQLPESEGGATMVNFMVKGDVHGSVEAVCACVLELGNHEVRPRVLWSAPGHITETDVEHAAISKAFIINFNLPISGQVKGLADQSGVRILDHTVIYHLTDDVKALLSERLTPDKSFSVVGEAEVLQVFPINIKGRKHKNVAGCRVRNGKMVRSNIFRVIRRGKTLYEGPLESLKHIKKDITEAKKGTECGIGFEVFQDLEVGDQIQALEEIETKRNL